MYVKLDPVDLRMLSVTMTEEDVDSQDKAETDHCPVCGRKDHRLSQGTHRCRAKDLQGVPLVEDRRSVRRASYHERLNEGFRLRRLTGD